jgi:hypothetical protein
MTGLRTFVLAVALVAVSFFVNNADASPAGGPILKATSLPGRHNDTYTLTLLGGEVTEVALVGDGSTDLDLYVYDYNGVLIGRAEGRGDRCFFRVTPGRTGKFTIKVVNRAPFANSYILSLL